MINVAAAASVAVTLLEGGGFQGVDDLRTLYDVYKDVKSGKKSFSTLAGPDLDAAERTLKILVPALGDPQKKAEILSLLQSL